MKKHISLGFLTALCGIVLLAGCNKEENGGVDRKITDLSADATANCYIVSSSGSYKFKTVRGNSATPVGSPSKAEVLWESFGTDVAPKVGDIVKSVEYKDGYVFFNTPGKLNNGNAVIAVKDAGGDILWSWHIWVCKDYAPTKDNQHVYNNNAGIVMDRNLGATSATPGDVHALGLLYQWGRKDPFLSAGRKPASTEVDAYDGEDVYGSVAGPVAYDQAASTLSWPAAVKSDASTGTIDYAIKHPTTYIQKIDSGKDWARVSETKRWHNTKKTEYDPCPAGWKVPSELPDSEGGFVTPWRMAFNSPIWTNPSNWDKTNLGMDFAKTDKKLGAYESIWYPAAGLRYYDGSLTYIGYVSAYWTTYAESSSALSLQFEGRGLVNAYQPVPCAVGASVRCVAE